MLFELLRLLRSLPPLPPPTGCAEAEGEAAEDEVGGGFRDYGGHLRFHRDAIDQSCDVWRARALNVDRSMLCVVEEIVIEGRGLSGADPSTRIAEDSRRTAGVVYTANLV